MLKSEKPKFDQWCAEMLIPVQQQAEQLLRDARTIASYKDVEFERDLATLRRRGQSEGLTFFCITMPKLMNEFLLSLETGIPSYSNFRVKKGTVYPTFLNGLFSLCDHEDCGGEAFSHVYQILTCFKKLKGPYQEDILKKCEDDFVAVDTYIGNLDFRNEFDDLVLTWARHFIYEVFQDVETDENFRALFVPRPGPGATNTPIHLIDRFRLNTGFSNMDEMLVVDNFYINYQEMHSDYKLNSLTSPPAMSRFKFVDKVVGKPRGICIEENEMQFLQQGLKHLMYKTIECHPYTKGKVNFSDQSINAGIALTSSVDKAYSTIDMSEASDRISRELVLDLFQDLPRMSAALDSLSTRLIEMPSGNILNTHKFAPMGSGICFPVMAIVHWSIIKSILYLSQHDDSLVREIYVYGDDIIVPSTVYETVTSILPRYGMKLNKTKSFCYSHFRESCGIHAYKGVDVTPIYFKYIPGIRHNLDGLQSLLAVEEQLYKKGLYCSARHIRACKFVAEDVAHKCHPTAGVLAFKRQCIHGSSIRGYKKRYNSKLLTWEFRVKTLVTSGDTLVSFSERDAYFRNLLLHASDHDDTWLASKAKVKWAWKTTAELYKDTPEWVKTYDKTISHTVRVGPRKYGPEFSFILV